MKKLTISQLVKKFSASYGTRSFTAVFTRVHYRTPSPTYFFKFHFNIILPSMRRSSKRSLYSSVFGLKYCRHISPFPCVLQVQPTASSLILTLKYHLINNTKYEALYYVIPPSSGLFHSRVFYHQGYAFFSCPTCIVANNQCSCHPYLELFPNRLR
jgi:hypothetical protein